MGVPKRHYHAGASQAMRFISRGFAFLDYQIAAAYSRSEPGYMCTVC